MGMHHLRRDHLMTYTIVHNDQGVWFIIPERLKEDWYQSGQWDDNIPHWATYVEDPHTVTFDDYRVVVEEPPC